MPITDVLLDDLQEDAPVRHVMMGAFWTAVVLDTEPARCGLASTLRGRASYQGPSIPEAGSLLDYSARELAARLRSVETCIGLAACNTLLDVDERTCAQVNASELILERGAGRRVAIVGHFLTGVSVLSAFG